MAKEGNVQPVPAVEEAFCGTDVLANLGEPCLHDVFFSHITPILSCFRVQRYDKKLKK